MSRPFYIVAGLACLTVFVLSEWVNGTETAAATAVVVKAGTRVKHLWNRTDYSAYAQYRFTVNGKTYTNETSGFGYAPGQTLTACYDPADPTRSSLQDKGKTCPPS